VAVRGRWRPTRRNIAPIVDSLSVVRPASFRSSPPAASYIFCFSILSSSSLLLPDVDQVRARRRTRRALERGERRRHAGETRKIRRRKVSGERGNGSGRTGGE
jgi:hypothetical protein